MKRYYGRHRSEAQDTGAIAHTHDAQDNFRHSFRDIQNCDARKLIL